MAFTVLFKIKAKENDRGGNYKVMSAIKFSGETQKLKRNSYCVVCFLFLAAFYQHSTRSYC